MNNVNGFTFYRSYFECLDKLPEAEQNILLRAIVYYVYKDTEPELDGIISALWSVIKPNLDTSKNRSLNPQKQNRNKKKTNEKQNKNKKKTNEKQEENNDLIDKDNDKDKEIEKDKEIDKEGINSFSTTKRTIYDIIEENFGRTLSSMEIEKISTWTEEYTEDIIEYAVRQSVMANKRSFNYVNGILRNWKSNGYKTLQEIKDHEQKWYEPRKTEYTDTDILDYNWLEDLDFE